MNEYTPDHWIILRIKPLTGAVIYKILASWSGGYTYGDSWKLSSGIKTFELSEDESTIVSEQYSKSVYHLRRSCERESSMIYSMRKSFEEKLVGIAQVDVISSEIILSWKI